MSLGCGKPAEGPVQMAPNKHKEGKVAWQQENKNSKGVKHLFIFIKVAIFLKKKKAISCIGGRNVQEKVYSPRVGRNVKTFCILEKQSDSLF